MFSKFAKLIISILASKLLESIYQYAGKIWAILSTVFGKNSTGTKAPHKNADPSETTFTIPVIAPLFFIRVDIKSDNVKVVKVNNKAFNENNKNLISNILALSKIIPNITYKSQTIKL